MNKCTMCSYHQFCSTAGQVLPRGSVTPDYYILGEQVSSTEDFNQEVFRGDQASIYLTSILDSLGIDESNARFFKAMRCPCLTAKDRNPDNINQCALYSMMDVFKTNPKIIIALGSEVTKYLLGERFTKMSAHRGRLYDIVVNGAEFKVMPTHSPEFILYKQDMTLGEQLLEDLQFAIKYVNGELSDMKAKELCAVKTYEEFMEYFNKHLVNCTTPSFDLETNAKEARSEGARMVGFSLAPDGSTGVYVLRESIDYIMPDEDWCKIRDVVKEYLSKCRCKVHNSMYEVPFTYNEWEFLIENFDDTLVKARLMLGGKTGAGLKEQCITQLGYPDWDKDIGDYLWGVRRVIDKLKPTKTSVRWDYQVLKESGIDGLWDAYESQELDKRCTEAQEGLKAIRQVIAKSYEREGEYLEITKLVSEELVRLIEVGHSGVPSYGIVPSKVIAKYGAMDAVATQDLDAFMNQRMSEDSKALGIDLFKGYSYWLGHFTVAAFMEMSGLYWNDDVANRCQKWYSDKCIYSMREMMNSGFLDDYIFNEHKGLLNDYIVDNLDEAVDILGQFKPMKSCIKLPDGSKITWKNLVKELDARTGGQWSASHKDVIMDIVKEKSKDVEYYTDMKWIFNPGSPKKENKDLLNSILITDDVRIAHFLNQLNLMMDNPEFNINRIPFPDRKLFLAIQESRDYNKSLEDDEFEFDDSSMKFFDEEDIEVEDEDSGSKTKVKITPKDTIKIFKELLEDMQFRSPEIGRMLGESYKYKMENTSEPTIIEVNSYYEILGIDVEDESTWTPNYKFLYDFRTWKKCNKMVTSYITGAKVGRGRVAVVDKESFQRGDVLTRRKRGYNDGLANENECYVMQSQFNVCGAETGRWKTGMHTIPTGANVKNIYTSRFENGLLFMPDYSAMEVRVIAGASNCEPMLKTFREGGDIHTENAARVWDKPASEITKEERRYSKMACCTGDTKIKLLDGTIRTMKELYESGNKDFYVYSFDRYAKKMRAGHVVDVQLTKYVTKTVRIHFDNGFSLECTDDHPILSMLDKYVLAGNLVEGTPIETLYTTIPTKGAYSFGNYEHIRDVRYSYECGTRNPNIKHTRYGKWIPTHKEILPHNTNLQIDHIDSDTLNNDPRNLRLLENYKNARRSKDESTDKYGVMKIARPIVQEIVDRGLDITKDTYELVRSEIYGKSYRGVPHYDTVIKYCEPRELLDRTESIISSELYHNPVSNFKKSDIECVRVVKVEEVYYDEAIPVYDLSVEEYHNYAVYLGDNTSIYVHNTFALLYGSDYRSFGMNFLDGDIPRAKKIFENFFSAFPQILDWVETKHDQMRKYGKVTTMTNRYITVTPDQFKGNEDKALRAAQNYPIN